MNTGPHKVILGIDPGTNLLGYGVISVDSKGPRYVTMGVFDLRKIATWEPTEMAIESPFYGKNAQVILKLGRAQGAAIIAATRQGIPVTEYAPRKAKIAICGNGAASKEQVSVMIQKTLQVELEPRYLDATDALAIALCHYYEQSSPLARLSGNASWSRFVEENSGRVRGGAPSSKGRRKTSWEDFLREHPDKEKKD